MNIHLLVPAILIQILGRALILDNAGIAIARWFGGNRHIFGWKIRWMWWIRWTLGKKKYAGDILILEGEPWGLSFISSMFYSSEIMMIPILNGSFNTNSCHWNVNIIRSNVVNPIKTIPKITMFMCLGSINHPQMVVIYGSQGSPE